MSHPDEPHGAAPLAAARAEALTWDAHPEMLLRIGRGGTVWVR